MKTDLIKGRLGRLKQLGTLLIYLAMVLIFTLLKPNYLTLTNFRSILIQAAMLGIISSGMTLVMMTGGVDMSVGAVAGVSTLAGMWPVVFDELPLAVGILIALGIDPETAEADACKMQASVFFRCRKIQMQMCLMDYFKRLGTS